MANSSAWGIDIGQSALKAVKLQYVESTGQVMASAFDYIQYPKILTQPDAVPDEIISDAMKTFLSRNDLQGEQVAMSVPGQTSLTRFIALPPVEAKKVHQIVQYEARQQIPFALEDVVWDYQRLGSGIEEGGFLLDAEVGLFAMKRDALSQAMRPYVQHKVELELVQIAPLALYNVLCYDELGQRPGSSDAESDFVIVLDMGCDNTTLMVSNGKKIWVRNVPIGGNHFTRALTKDMKLSFAKAELLKCNATKSEDPRAVFQALRPVFNDFVSEIQRSIGFFSSVNRQAKIAKVVGLGNGFKLAGLQKFLQQNLQYDVERPDVYKALAGDAVVNSPMFAENVLSFAVPYGLALQLVGQTFIKTSLLPPEITRERVIRRKKPWAVATAATLLMGTALATLGNAFPYLAVHNKPFEEAEKEAKAFGDTVAGLKASYTAEEGRNTAAYAQLDSAIKGRRGVPWLAIYDAVNDSLPREKEVSLVEAKPINLREQMCVEEITAQKVADLDADWFSKIEPSYKDYMADDEKEAGPSGEGYVFSIRAVHWHEGTEITDLGQLYIEKTILKNLQELRKNGDPERKTSNLGITHATMVQFEPSVFIDDPNLGKAAARAPRLDVLGGGRPGLPGVGNAGPIGGGRGRSDGDDDEGMGFGRGLGGAPGITPLPGVGGPRPGAQGVSPDAKERPYWRFVIQFAYRPVLEGAEEGATEGTEAAAAASSDSE